MKNKSSIKKNIIAIVLLGFCSQVLSSTESLKKNINGIWVVENSTTKILTVENKIPPLNEEGEEIYEEHNRKYKDDDRSFDRTTWCASPGYPRLILANHPFEIAVSNRRVAFMSSWANWYRTVDMSGETWAIPEEYSSVGVALGRWNADTLVIETTGLKSDVVMDQYGLPVSWAMKITEHIKLLSKNRLEIRFVIEDPEYYSKPWEMIKTFKRMETNHVQEYICLDEIKKGHPPLIEG